jgi:hypothetical protein
MCPSPRWGAAAATESKSQAIPSTPRGYFLFYGAVRQHSLMKFDNCFTFSIDAST